MASLVRWVVGKVSSTTNSALESVLGRIITRFLEEPIADDAFALQLFEDWTMTVKLKQVFLDVKMVNSCVNFLIFRSIYLANFKFDARYNLSKFNIELSRTLLEIDLCEDVEKEKVDENLTASIQEFTEQLPVKKEGGWKNWFLNKVKQILFKLESLTVILKSGGTLEDLKLMIQDVNYSYENSVMRAVVPSVSVQIGEKKSQREVMLVSNIDFQLKDGVVHVVVNEVSVNVAENVILTVFGVIDRIMKHLAQKPVTAAPEESADEKFVKGVVVTLKRVKVRASEIVLCAEMLKVSLHDNVVSIELEDMDVMHGDMCILTVEHQSLAKFALTVTTPLDAELSIFEKPPENTAFNALGITLKLPIFVLSITKEFVEEVMSIVSWASALPAKAPAKEVSTSKSSLALSLYAPELSVRVQTLSLCVRHVECGLWTSQVPTHSYLHTSIAVGDVQFSTGPTFSVVQFARRQPRNCLVKVSIVDVPEHDKKITIDGNAEPFLVRVPNRFDFVDSLRALLPKLPESNTPQSQPQPTDVTFAVALSRIYVDYLTINMPARAILELSELSAKGDGKIQSNEWSICVGTVANLYFSNIREDLPLQAFQGQSFPSTQLSFAHMGTVRLESVEVSVGSKTVVNIPKVVASGGVCLDSIRVFVAFLMHIQYKLDMPPEQQTPTRKFEMPDHLLQLTQTLTQSMNLAKLEYKEEEQPIIVPDIYDSIEDLVASVKMEHEDPVVDDDDQPPMLVESSQPASEESTTITIGEVELDFRIYGGRDLREIWNLQPITQIPRITSRKFTTDDDYEIVTNRDEFNSIQVAAAGNFRISLFTGDPLVSVRILFEFANFSVLDHIQNSVSRLLFGTDDDTQKLHGIIDLLTTTKERTELSLRLQMPNMAMFITQEQIDFFMACAEASKVPRFPSDSVTDEPLAFQLFQLVPSNLHISAHFRLWLDIHLDDIDIKVPECSLFALRGFDGLIGALAEFYFAELSKPGAIAVVGGLPVIKNLRRITAAVRDLFAFDVQRYGVAEGFGKSLAALLQIIAMETLNAGANAASIAERFLGVAMKLFGGKKDDDSAMKSGVATLVVQSKKDGKLMKSIPSIVLAPGIISLQKLNEMMKAMRDKINPDLKKRMKYRKDRHNDV